MKANVRVRPGYLQSRHNLIALSEIFRENVRYLVTIHEGRIAKYAQVPPDQVIKLDTNEVVRDKD